MEKTYNANDIVLLFNYYDTDSQNLHSSFLLDGYECPAIVIEDDGFVPENVVSIYGYYMGDYSECEELPGKPLYFNQVTIPDFWEITATSQSAKINDKQYERAHIFYTELRNKRLVKHVEWMDASGIVRSIDHYNQYGGIFARTVCNKRGKAIVKSYFSPNGKEIITENYVTGAIIVNDEEKIKIFHSKTELVIDFIKEQNLEDCRFFYNSLSTPFFVSEKLRAGSEKRDILFWQEDARPDIPGNMMIILDGKATRTNTIMVQKRHAYNRLIQLGADSNVLHKLGYIYPFQKNNQHMAEALVCTNSENVEQLERFAQEIPEMMFHVVALTEMSAKLMAKGKYDNVRLYPAAKEAVFDELFERCDYYLDINRENEIMNAVSEAFLFNHLILAFSETVHNVNYVADEHIYRIHSVDRMISDLKLFMQDERVFYKHLRMQQEAALAEAEYLFEE